MSPEAAELDAIRRLVEDVPALWHAPTTTAGNRQAIARLVLDHVTVQVEGERESIKERDGSGNLHRFA